MLATHAQETCASRLVQETCTCVSPSGTSFFLYKFLEQVCSSTETLWHMTGTVQRDWPASCFCARNCDELASNFSCKFPEQVSWACVAGIRLVSTSL